MSQHILLPQGDAAEPSLNAQILGNPRAEFSDTLQELGDVGGWEFDLVTLELKWSVQTHRIMGTSPASFTPSVAWFLDRVHADDRLQVEQALMASRNHPGDYTLAHRVEPMGGDRQRFVELRWRVLPQAGNRPTRAIGICRDITRDRQVEQALLLSEERFRRTFHDAAIGIAVTGIDGRFLEANAAFCRMLGYSVGEMRGLDQWSVTDPRDRAAQSVLLHSLLTGERQSFVADKRYRSRSGAVVWCRTSVSVVGDENGMRSSVVHVAEDITAEHESRSQLLATEERLEFALSAARVGYWDRDLATGATWRTLQHDACFGYPVQLPEWLYENFLACVHPDDRERVDALYHAAERGQGDHESEFRVIWPDGSEHWLLSIGRFFYGDDGTAQRVSGIVLDISAHKRAEQKALESAERFRILADATHDAIWDWDIVHDRLWWSEGFASLFGYAAGAVTPDVAFWAARIHPDDRQRVLDSIDARLQGPDHAWEARYRFLRADGAYAQVADRGRVLRDVFGRATRMVGGMSDVTERLALEERLRQAQRLEAVGQFTGGLAHDFNNLLTIVLGNAEILLERLVDPFHRELVDMVFSAAQSGADLTQRLLAFARRQQLDPRPIDMNAFVAGLRPVLRRALGETVELDLRVGEQALATLIDPGQLESALLNLVLNARDAMSGIGRLTVETASVQLDPTYCAQFADLVPGPYVQLAVSDTGSGISPENLARIFEPFFTTKAHGKGTGLGLAMVYGFVKQSGGHLTVQSQLGQGTTMQLFLPVASQLPQAQGDSGELVAAAGGTETVLLVDDNAAVRQYAHRQLRALGYDVHVAADAHQALQMLDSGLAVDLLFTDIQMPGMDGRKLAEIASRTRPALKVLFCSGLSDDACGQAVGRLADVQWLSKPYRRHQLARYIRLALDTPSDADRVRLQNGGRCD